MKIIISVLAGFIAGAASVLLVAVNMFPSMMITTKESRFGFEETVNMIDESS